MKREMHNFWREKLTRDGLEYLDEYRRQKLNAQAEERKGGPVNLLDELDARFRSTSKSESDRESFDELKKENPEAAEMIQKCLREANINLLSIPLSDLWNHIAMSLEISGPRGRKGIAFGLAVAVHGILGTYREARRRHFGDAEISDRQSLWVLGTALETIGNTLRTGELTPTTKGRVNIELVDMILTIRKHETSRLTYRELKDALEYVLFPIPDEDWLRVFVHRSRKRGLL
jgi:hypothetical protein